MYEGFEEEVIVVGGRGVVEEGGMVRVAGVFDEEVFGLGVFILGLCNGPEKVSVAEQLERKVVGLIKTYEPSIGSVYRPETADIVSRLSQSRLN